MHRVATAFFSRNDTSGECESHFFVPPYLPRQGIRDEQATADDIPYPQRHRVRVFHQRPAAARAVKVPVGGDSCNLNRWYLSITVPTVGAEIVLRSVGRGHEGHISGRLFADIADICHGVSVDKILHGLVPYEIVEILLSAIEGREVQASGNTPDAVKRTRLI